MTRPSTKKPYRLLVEGNDDIHVVANLCKAHGIPDTFDIIEQKGIENLLDALPVTLKSDELEILGVLVDADMDLQARWQSLCKILAKAGYTTPKQPMPEGVILYAEERPTVGIWLMPDNHLPGMLENFVAELIPAGDALLPYVQKCVQGLPEQRFPSAQCAKAEIHTWLAWQGEPGKPMGQAITARYLDANAAKAGKFIAWLRRLFVIDK